MKKLITILSVLALLLTLLGCSNEGPSFYTVTFDTDGGLEVESQYIKKGGKVVEPKAPVKEDATFKEWRLDGVKYNFSTPVTSDITLKAAYTAIHTVKFDTDEGMVEIENQYIEDGGKVIEPKDPVKEDATFKEWRLNGVRYDFSSPVTSDITLKATYTAIHTVKFDTDEGMVEIENQYIEDGGTIIEPKDPEKEYCMFREWRLNGVKYDFSSPVTSDITLKAEYWTLHIVEFDTDGGSSITPMEVIDGTALVEPADPVKEGTGGFAKWMRVFDDGSEEYYDFSKEEPVTEDMKLRAVYKETEAYTVYFDNDGGTETPCQNLKSGDKVVQPRDPSKGNLYFKEWVKVDSKGTVSKDAYNFNEPVTENFTLKAVYYTTYTVNILSDDGSVSSTQYVKEDDYAVEPKTPVNKTKWGFKEWLLMKADGSTSSFDFASTKVTSDLTIRADYWEKYTVTFKDTYGIVYSKQTVKENTNAVKIDAPSKSGAWSFKYWVVEGTETEYNFDSAVVSDITLVATYFNGYTVTFDSDGGTYTPEKQFVKDGEKASEPKSPDKNGTKGFMWWTKDGKYYDFSTPVTSDITLKAVYWKAATADRETYDQDVIDLKNEVRCLHNITRTLLNNTYCKDLMNGATDIKSIFSISDDGSSGDTAKYLFANMRMNEDRLVINGERYTLDNVNMKIDLTKDSSKKITKNASSIVQGTGYTIDIEGLTFETTCYPQGEGNPAEKLTSTMSVKGTVIKHSDERYEFHLQFTIVNNGIETVYPVIHAGAIKSGEDGDDNILFYSFRGYTGYIPNITLW